ncbi:MAG TPA: peptidylprolyl isomerase [Caulobacteraceae bacterium]|nr:peptidylprolyl isomerase [Caulobacteraceae bacterium]
MRLGLAILVFGVLLASSAVAAPEPKAPDWRQADPENTLVIDTSKGRIIVEMTPLVAPRHVAQIKALARQKLYDGRAFFRVIDWFMDQTGDPMDTGEGGSSLPDLKAEFTFRRDASTPFTTVSAPMGAEEGLVGSLPVVSQAGALMKLTPDHQVSAWAAYCPGVAGMARAADPDSANSQFFLMRQAYPSLDQRFTAWGKVLVGLDVVRAIKTGEPVQDPDRMLAVRVLADLPEAERPRIYVMDANGPAFARLLARTRREKGADFSVCDIDLPVMVR